MMMIRNTLLLGVVVILLVQLTSGLDASGAVQGLLSNLTVLKQQHHAKISYGITPIDSCRVKMDDGQIVDLSSLDNPKSPITDSEAQYTYQFNPCTSIPCDKDVPAAICQTFVNDQKLKYTLGAQSAAQWQYDGTALTLTFTGGSEARKSIITCTCADSEQLNFVREQPSKTYSFTFQSKCCCPGKCNGKKGGGSGKLTFGSILCIIFFSLLGAYFIGGIIFMKFVKNKSGSEMIPNSEIWLGMPGNIKAGFSFTMSKIRGGGNSYQPV